MPTVRVFGIGNRWRGDDAAGPATAAILRAMNLPGVAVREECDGGTAMLNAWDPSDTVYFIDAAVSGAPPGSIHRIDANEGHVPSDVFPCSTHELGAAEVAEFARALGRLPRHLVLYGIEGADFAHGEGMTAAVAAACRKAAEAIRDEIASAGRAEGAEGHAPGGGAHGFRHA
jgi:hydrogenase maturation protease